MGDLGPDGRFYTGPEFGWQTAPTARKHGLLGSEVLAVPLFQSAQPHLGKTSSGRTPCSEAGPSLPP
jgi:hypothetical protein